MTNKLITADTLRQWRACQEGYDFFNRLYPGGADLATASAGLIDAGHPEWSNWLWRHCAESKDPLYQCQTMVIAGYRGTATAGNYGTATAGDWGTATAGYRGTATAGYRGTATTGHRGTAIAGEHGTATTGEHGTATAGIGGCLVIRYYEAGQKGCNRAAEVDGVRIKPNVAYRLDEQGQFIEA